MKVRAEKLMKPPRLGSFRIEVIAPPPHLVEEPGAPKQQIGPS